MILFDSSPLFPHSDAALLSEYIDGTILVIQAGVTRRGITQRAVNILKNSKANILGVILNQLEHEVPAYNYYRYR
jgi:Mrp family chromosome partitioning ATPase